MSELDLYFIKWVLAVSTSQTLLIYTVRGVGWGGLTVLRLAIELLVLGLLGKLLIYLPSLLCFLQPDMLY